jgi:nitrogen regulatory protein P-II 2
LPDEWAKQRFGNSISSSTPSEHPHMQLHPLKHVTVVTEQRLRDQLARKVLELGASGCTYQEVQGTGSRGTRGEDVFGGNVRLDVICDQQVAEAIMTYVSHNFFEHHACIAWLTDVSVVRGSRYLKKPG